MGFRVAIVRPSNRTDKRSADDGRNNPQQSSWKIGQIKQGSLGASQTMLTTLQSDRLGAFELRKVVSYIRDEFEFSTPVVALSIGVPLGQLTEMMTGRRQMTEEAMIQLRRLFSTEPYAA